MVFRIVDGGRLADHVEQPVVVLPAGGNPLENDVGDRHVRRGEGVLGIGLLGFGGLHLIRGFVARPRPDFVGGGGGPD